MWELIKSNQRKSVFLFTGMAVTLMLLGYLIGSTFYPDGGGVFGLSIAIIIWTVLSIISVTAGSSLVLSISQAKEVTPAVHQQLFNVVEEMKLAAGLPAMPKVYIIDSSALNAFATGKDPSHSAVAVTAGLLSKLNRDELQGVIGHEMSHIMNRDTKFMTYAAVMLGTIVIISEIFVKGMFYSGAGRRYGSRSKNSGGQAQIIILAIAVIFAILAPIMARLLYFALSRKREYLADASSARLTRYPEGLASALEKISDCSDDLPSANKVTAAMYIANPLKKKGMKLSDLSSTHPPISERIRILRGMMYGAGFSDYQKSFSALKRSSAAIIPASGLRDAAVIPLRAAGEDQAEPQTAVQEKRKLGNIMMAVNDYSTINCECGLKIKMPPGFGMNRPEITCPRCGRKHRVESAGRIKI
ncbi:MAG TPA: M48 family metallopeptidase [Ignavibacteriaceae bacterium]|nr:M48 family metallopeptidase [Ignavibacteriaceae bacterium]